MKLIVCLDDRNGMMFLNRRQSQDRLLRQRVLDMTCGGCLWMNCYSAEQFSENVPQIRVDEGFLDKAGNGDYCFVENLDVLPWKDRVQELIVYRWNRHYPSDVQFPLESFTERMQKQSTAQFPGSSHDCILEEVYSL